MSTDVAIWTSRAEQFGPNRTFERLPLPMIRSATAEIGFDNGRIYLYFDA